MKFPFLDQIKKIFGGSSKTQTRGYSEVISVGGQNDDWPVNQLGEDADVWTNAYALTSRVRDLFRTNPLFGAYRETVLANVFGAEGMMLRAKVKEAEDRVIHTPDEERAILAYEARYNRVAEWYAKKEGREFLERTMLRFGNNGTRKATVKVGDPDIFANLLIERAWKEWSRREFCDVRGVRNYQTMRQLRLISAIRDGDFFIRMIRDPRVNKFGFSLQLINSEWCDRFLNVTLDNGNVIRMGIEYPQTAWGIGKPVAYHFIKRQPRDWQFSMQGGFGYRGPGLSHDRIPAEEIIHYARVVDADSTRPAPWVASTIGSSRQLDEAMKAEVTAWRASACKTGWLESTVVPEGGVLAAPDPTKIAEIRVEPGGEYGLPWGVTRKESDPKHPNANAEEFRKAMVRSITAGMPGADYSRMANDYEAINFSAGRLQRLDTNETFMVLQTFDIDYAERIIFENFLFMALVTDAIPLPLAKFDKFNNVVISGRRWGQVDEIKQVTAAALRVANNFSSDHRECAALGVDLEDILIEQAEANMAKEELGLPIAKTVDPRASMPPEEEEDEPPTKPEKKGRRAPALTV